MPDLVHSSSPEHPNSTQNQPLFPPVPPVPGAKQVSLLDPSWWRLGLPVFIALVLAAAAADLLIPNSGGIGVGAAIGVGCLIASLLTLRRDYSRMEQVFLCALGVLSMLALAWRGSGFNLFACLVIPLVLHMMPSRFPVDPQAKYRSWWEFWLAHRSPASCKKLLPGVRRMMPTLLSIAVGIIVFTVFLSIFASGNPVVRVIWETMVQVWNQMLNLLHISWDFWLHALLWLIGIILFGFYTVRRSTAFALPNKMASAHTGQSLLPHLPLAVLIGMNCSFLIACSTDIVYLWQRVVPEGISQTDYLYNGAYSITWASVLATAALVFLFRKEGSSRKSVITRTAGFLLLGQTFLLAVSVYFRLNYQIDDMGYTPRRVVALESLLFGLVGLVILLFYMMGSGLFFRYARLCLGTMALMLVACGISTPAELAASFNLRGAASHPQWVFSASEFSASCFRIEEHLEFAQYVQERTGNAYLASRLYQAAEKLETRVQQEGWTHWNLSMQRDIPIAEKILGRPIRPVPVEAVH